LPLPLKIRAFAVAQHCLSVNHSHSSVDQFFIVFLESHHIYLATDIFRTLPFWLLFHIVVLVQQQLSAFLLNLEDIAIQFVIGLFKTLKYNMTYCFRWLLVLVTDFLVLIKHSVESYIELSFFAQYHFTFMVEVRVFRAVRSNIIFDLQVSLLSCFNKCLPCVI
jgi:hypothetical protein